MLASLCSLSKDSPLDFTDCSVIGSFRFTWKFDIQSKPLILPRCLSLDTMPNQPDNNLPDGVAKFVSARCKEAKAHTEGKLNNYFDLNYIAGNTVAVATVSQVWVIPANAAMAGDVGSTFSTWSVNTWPGTPVGVHDSVIYTGAGIVHSRSMIPALSSSRLTYEIVGVTRAK